MNKYNNIKQLCAKEISYIEKSIINSISINQELKENILDFLTAPSKRIRPLLAILYIKSFGYELSDTQLELLCAIELLHNASLIHDDIIDDSEYRRGVKTLYSSFGPKLAVISGDYLLAKAFEKIAKLNNKFILQNLSKTLEQMCVGEINQNFDRYKIGTIDDYIEKSKNKTAYLFESAISCCISEGENDIDIVTAGKFGLNVGIAFQIRDDLLNLVDKNSDKPVKNDIEEGIYNAPVIYSNSVDNYFDGVEKTKVLLNNYINKAYNLIKNLPENVYKKALYEFLELLKI